MAQEGSEASVASSSPTPNWWEIHANPMSSWNAMNRWQAPHRNSSCVDQDMSNMSTTSFANASNQSALSMDSSSADLSGETAENRLWSQVLFSVGNGGADLHADNHEDGEKFLGGTEMFNPACDYLKKLDSSWEFATHSPAASRYTNGSAMIEPERLTNLSDLVTNWSIAPPITTPPFNFPLNPAMLSQIKHAIPNPPSYSLWHQDHVGAPFGYQLAGLNNSMIGLNNARSLSTDAFAFGACLSKPAMAFRSTAKKQGYETCSSTKGSGRGSGTTTSEGKKKRSEDSSGTVFKKSKLDSSNASSVKTQPPKVKVLDKITALQQIVSPFGKTDTASVLMEAINYIRFLQEQVQLLSDPYLKSSANKDHNSSWGGLERKDMAGSTKLDLGSRGLCLVPVSCTPQACRENSGPDYWTPTYRGCLYR